MPRTIRASHPESRWHSSSFAIGSNCRASSSARKVYSHFSCLGASPCLRLSVEISWTTWSGCWCLWGTPRHILTQVRARYCDLEGHLAKLYGAFDADTTDRSDSFYTPHSCGKLFLNIIFERKDYHYSLIKNYKLHKVNKIYLHLFLVRKILIKIEIKIFFDDNTILSLSSDIIIIFICLLLKNISYCIY